MVNVLRSTVNTYIYVVFLTSPVAMAAEAPTPTLSLEQAQRAARAAFPAAANHALFDELLAQQQSVITRSRLPVLKWKADARLQSEVPGLDGANLPIAIDRPLYSVQTYLDLGLTLYDGGTKSAQSEHLRVANRVAHTETELDEDLLIQRVNQAFFAVLRARRLFAALQVTQEDLKVRKMPLEAGLRLGTVLQSELLKLEVQELDIRAQLLAAEGDEAAALASLRVLTQQDLSAQTKLHLPSLPSTTEEDTNKQLEVLERRAEELDSQSKVVGRQRWPQARLFGQAGVGYPNPLNLFDSGVAPFAVVGLGLSWQFWDWSILSKQQDQLRIQKEVLANKRRSLSDSNNARAQELQALITRLHSQLEVTEQQTQLRAEILKTTASQLEFGVATSADYVTESNAELRSRLQRDLLRVGIEEAKANYLSLLGHWNRNHE